MRVLFLHSDSISIEAKSKAIKDADEKVEPIFAEESLVAYVAVEEGDEDVEASAERLVKEVLDVYEKVQAKNVVLYPYVHLTSKPSAPRVAKKVLEVAERKLRERGIEVQRAPFGWYKAFTISVKGHPLSELSREIKPGEGEKINEEETTESLEMEEKLKSKFYILDEGGLTPLEDYELKEGLFKKMVDYETKKNRVYDKAPPHIRIMQEQELVDYEGGSDPGHFRYYPKGKLIKKVLERSITDFCLDYGAHEVETPIMYDFEHPSLKKYMHRFPARQYVVKSDDKKLFLRFAACFGQFLIAHDAQISYRQLPLKLYELTRYSFRREQSGELAGLKRLRAFSMPDMHTIVRDMEMAKQEFENQLKACMEYLDKFGLMDDIQIAFRIQTDFYKENEEWYKSLAKKVGKPILVEMYDERYAYFITKFEFNFIDSMDKATTLSTVQIDVENAETYDISFVDEDGKRKRPYILHASISGAIERLFYALLEREAMKMEKGEKAGFPTWLAPTQLRLIPVSNEKHLEHVKEIARKLEGREVRYDIDDREETLNRKIRTAQKEWVPYIAVVGDKEMESGKLSITIRESGEKAEMSIDEIAERIEKENIHYEKRTYPALMSKRPIFRQVL